MAPVEMRAPTEPVLSTLNEDGTRRWLEPRMTFGRFRARRKAVAYGLIAIFCGIPFVKIGGLPAILLDIPGRKFTFFGSTFLATDTLLLMLLALSIVLGVFFLTALFGRVWCGWGCPQTVYMEFVFRPLGRWIEGGGKNVERGSVRPSAGRRTLKFSAYLAVCGFLAHVFLGYFVGIEQLTGWMSGSPKDHWSSFMLVAFVTAAMMFDFAYFREQTCLVACPYGRLQSVLLDRSSLIVGYDTGRGEPRGKGKRTAVLALGDCVDCNKCVATCPTGIDIRDGLQMECIHCTQCIDACDTVMDKMGKPRGLIRYSSKDELAGKGRHFLRPRTLIYPTLLLVVFTLFITALVTRSSTDLMVFRARGAPYEKLADGRTMNRLRVQIVNRDTVSHTYQISIAPIEGLSLRGPTTTEPLDPGESTELALSLTFPKQAVDGSGEREIEIEVESDVGETVTGGFTLLAPRRSERTP